jgi:hypothetical protein
LTSGMWMVCIAVDVVDLEVGWGDLRDLSSVGVRFRSHTSIIS